MRLLRELGPSLLIGLSLVAFGIGCGGGDGGGKAAGVEGGACYPNDTCNNGLDCSLPSKICVRPPTGSAGTGGGAGTTGAGGSASGGTTGAAGTTGVAGNAAGGTGGSASAGTSGSAGTTGTAGTSGSAGTTGAAGAGGRGGSGGSGGSGGTTGSAGTGGSGGAGGTGGSTARYTLTISLDVVIVMPTGGGAPKPGPVTSVPTGITCGGSFISGSNNGDCEESYTNGTSVVLTAQGNSVVNFTAWTGDCSGTNPVITVVMDKARNCKATFTQITN
jgi:uncharacterized repeat protein (TIGR02543 family)